MILSSFGFPEYAGAAEDELKSNLGVPRSSRRTLIEPHKGDKRYLRRNTKGQFKSEVNVGRSLAADKRRRAKTKAPKGQRDRGD